NFQRVPVVDTSNPFIARFIPTPDESFLVIHFSNPRGIDFPYLLSMLHDSFMSRANTIVCPGGKMDLAMQLIFTPMIWRLLECRREQAGRGAQVVREIWSGKALFSMSIGPLPIRRSCIARRSTWHLPPAASTGVGTRGCTASCCA